MEVLFSETFWLPTNVSWKDLENAPTGVFYPTFRSLFYLPLYTFVLLLVRYLIETLIFKPIGRWLGMKDYQSIRLQSNPRLEETYRKEKRPSAELVKELAISCDWTERHVEHWFRKRRNVDKFSPMTKWTESGWRFTFYLTAFVYGAAVLRNKPWLANPRHCWIGHPFQDVPDEIYWYYMLELSFYCSAVVSIFIEVKRKDFWQMFIHHVATIMLVTFSWFTNFVRIGTLICLVHDVADPWMEAAKLAKYSRHEKTSVTFFIVFTVTWIVTRLYFYPFWLLKSVIFDTIEILDPFPSLWLFLVLLSLLQCLHVLWTILILKIPYGMLTQGDKVKDSRSDSEMESLSGDENGNTICSNGTNLKKTN